MIKPACQEAGISYVELVARERPHMRVDTFVSHWWGVEFPFFIRSLDRYARLRCGVGLWRDTCMFLAIATLLCVAPVAAAFGYSVRQGWGLKVLCTATYILVVF